MIGLALEGGGAKGSYQAGAYMALKKCHVKINAVAGTSIGSLNGAFIAAHEEKKMLDLWQDVTMSEIIGIDDDKLTEVLRSGITFDNIKWTFNELSKVFKNKGLDMSNYRALVRNNINEDKIRKSNIKFGLTTVKQDTLKPLELFMEDIPKGTLHDYIVASSYLPGFKKEKLVDDSYYLDGGFYNLCPTDMLEKIGCDKIYTVNIKGIGVRKNNFRSTAEIIEIKPNNDLGSIIFFNQQSNVNNITYGYFDTLKVLKKIDGFKYYFKKKSNWYYKRLNHNISEKHLKACQALVNGHDYKDTVLKALEYVLKKENESDLKLYKQNQIIKSIKRIKNDNIVYRYVSKLSIF